MFDTTIAGSLPKPAWLAETEQAVAAVAARTAPSSQAPSATPRCWRSRRRRTAGIDVVDDGEQSRQHFVHGFLELVDGIDFAHKVEMGIRDDRYKAMVPQVTGALRLKGRVHATEARFARAHTQAQAQVHPARADDHRRHRGRRATTATGWRWPWRSPTCSTQEARALRPTAST